MPSVLLSLHMCQICLHQNDMYFGTTVSNAWVRNRILGGDMKSINEVVNLHQMRRLGCVTYPKPPPTSMDDAFWCESRLEES